MFFFHFLVYLSYCFVLNGFPDKWVHLSNVFFLCYVLFSTFSNNLVWVCVLFSFLFHLLSMVTRNFNVCFSISVSSRFLIFYLLCTTRFLLAVTSYVMPFLKNRFFSWQLRSCNVNKNWCKQLFSRIDFIVFTFSIVCISLFFVMAVVVINSSSISSSIVYITTWLCVYVWVNVFLFASNLWTFKALCTDHLNCSLAWIFNVFTELRFWRFGELNF